MKQERSFKLDKATGKYILSVKNEGDVISGDKPVAFQTSETKQIWDKKEVTKLLDQIAEQRDKVTKALDQTKSQMKSLGVYSPRKRDMLKEFKRKMEEVQKLQKLEQLEQQQKAQKDMLEAIIKDEKEIADAIKSS